MFALTGKSRGKSRIAPKRRELAGHLVVPRMLRRPARLFSKIFAGDITVPRYAEAAGLASIFAATAIYGAVAGGQFGSVANEELQHSHEQRASAPSRTMSFSFATDKELRPLVTT